MSDILLHILAGGVITGALLMFKKPVAGRRPDWLVLLAIGIACFVGVAKEIGDKVFGWGAPEIADITATWAGGVLALAVVAMIDWIRYKHN